MNENAKFIQIEEQITRVIRQVEELSQAFYKNNFSSEQIFPKSCNFTTKLKIPSYTVLPTCQVGEIAESGGILYICSATDVWTVAGTQS
jgi:hypothetical protein